MSEGDEGTVPSRSGSRRFLIGALLVLGPAIVGGLITIAPAIYQQITLPTALLTYTRTTGPAISTASGYRQISTFTIANAGKVPLTGLIVDVSTETGQIESSAINSPRGTVAKEQASPKDYQATIERLLPDDVVRASVMAASASPDAPLSLAVRSNEVLGTEAASGQEKPEKGLAFELVFATSGALFAVLSSLVAFMLARRIAGDSSSDVIRYALFLSQAVPLELNGYAQGQLTYIGAGDLLLAAGLRGDAAMKSRCVAGLTALLSVERRMRPASAAAIRDNLRRLGVSMSDAEFAKMRATAANPTRDLVAARRLIASFFE